MKNAKSKKILIACFMCLVMAFSSAHGIFMKDLTSAKAESIPEQSESYTEPTEIP